MKKQLLALNTFKLFFMIICTFDCFAEDIQLDVVDLEEKLFEISDGGTMPLFSCNDEHQKLIEGCSVDLIDKLKSVYNCKRIPGLYSCVPFVAMFSGGIAGLSIWAIHRNELQFELKHKAKNMIPEIAGLLHDEWRKPRSINYSEYMDEITEEEKNLKKQPSLTPENKKRLIEIQQERSFLEEARNKGNKKFYQPRIKNVGGKFIDIANSSFIELPQQFKAENFKSAQIAMGEIMDRTYSFKPIDKKMIEEASEVIHIEWLKRNGDWATPDQKLPFNQLSKVEADKDRIIVQKAIEFVKQDIIKTTGRVSYAIGKQARKGAGRFVALGGGALGLAAILLEEGLSATKTGCSELGDNQINLDGNCKPVYEVNSNVLKLLTSSTEELSYSLQTPKVCQYYKTLLSKLTEVPKVKKLSCNKNSFSMNLKDGYQYSVHGRINEDGNLNYVSTKSFNGPVKFVFDENEKLSHFNVQVGSLLIPKDLEYNGSSLESYETKTYGASKKYSKFKPLVSAAKECCTLPIDKQSSCIKELEEI